MDNVIVAISLSNKIWVLLTGVFIGIIIIRFAATIFQKLIDKEPALEHAAYVLIFVIAIELLLKETFGTEISEVPKLGISVATLVLVVVVARIAASFRF